MSATGRGAVRANRDFYPTDPRLVRVLLRALDAGRIPLKIPRGGVWVEPCAGDGAIVAAVDGLWLPEQNGREWITVDVRPETGADFIADFRDPSVARGGNVYITNPPFSMSIEIADVCFQKAEEAGGYAIVLVNNHFFGPKKNLPFFDTYDGKIDRVPVSPRPSFGRNKKGHKATDQCTYEWIILGPDTSGRWFGPFDWRRA